MTQVIHHLYQTDAVEIAHRLMRRGARVIFDPWPDDEAQLTFDHSWESDYREIRESLAASEILGDARA